MQLASLDNHSSADGGSEACFNPNTSALSKH
jgi:hypothetical protein